MFRRLTMVFTIISLGVGFGLVIQLYFRRVAELTEIGYVRADILAEKIMVLSRDMGEVKAVGDALYRDVKELRTRTAELTELPEESKIASRILKVEENLRGLEGKTAKLEVLVRTRPEETEDFEKRMDRIEQRIIKNPEEALGVRLLEDKLAYLEKDIEKRALGETVRILQGSMTLLGALMGVTVAAVAIILSVVVVIMKR